MCHATIKYGDDMEIDIAGRIRTLREAAGLSTNKLSDMAGLSQSYVRKLENNESNPTIDSLAQLCDALNISIADFLNYQEASLQELRVIALLKNLNETQLDGLYHLLAPPEQE